MKKLLTIAFVGVTPSIAWALNAPSGVTAKAVSSTQIIVTWKDRSSNETGFVLFRSISGGAFARHAILPANTTSFTDSGLQPGAQYGYKLEAVSESAFSSIASATTPADKPPPSGDFPDATNTGVPVGVTLTPSGSIEIKKAGAVITGLDVTGEVVIKAPNVTLKNSRVRAKSWAAVVVLATGAVVEDSDISSIYAGGGTKGILFDDGASGGVALRNNIHHVEDGVYISASDTLVAHNYVHDSAAASADPHFDGIQLSAGVSNVVVRHNNVDTPNPEQNSAITMGNNEGILDGVLVENNRLVGGGYTARCDGRGSYPVTNISFLNNHIADGVWGYTAFDGKCSPVFIGNVDEPKGVPINP